MNIIYFPSQNGDADFGWGPSRVFLGPESGKFARLCGVRNARIKKLVANLSWRTMRFCKSDRTAIDIAYNIGQGLAAGPTQGFGAAFGKSIEGTPWASGPVDIATGAIVTKFMSIATGARTLQTLNGAVELGSVLGEGAEYATGFGEVKLAYDFATFAGSLAGCAAGIIR